MKTFKLHMIRHGLTQGNLDNIFMGGGVDQPLCQQGIDQLRELEARYPYPGGGVLFCSPMRRAIESAEILYPLLANRLVVEDIRENRFGVFEGKSFSDMANDPNFAKWLDPDSDFVPEGGESGQEFAGRLDRGFASMFKYMMDEGITEGICVTHGGVIMSLLGRWALPQKPPTEWMSDNGCGFTVQTSTAMLMRDQKVEAVEIIPKGYLHQNSPF